MAVSEVSSMLKQAREAFVGRQWVLAYQRFLEARTQEAFEPEDLAALADSAWWLGLIEESVAAFEEAYTHHIGKGEPRAAAIAALSIGYTLALQGEEPIASGWISRAHRLLMDEDDCVEKAFLTYIDIEFAYGEREYEAVIAMGRRLRDMGARFNSPDLMALGVLSEGLAIARLGDVRHGMELLDEAMLAALSDDLDPSWAGNIYCHMMAACHELGDIRRATAWTNATSAWCDTLTAHGPFLGICRVYRAHVHCLQGNWDLAEHEAHLVSTGEMRFDITSVAEAYYQCAELDRLRGNLVSADAGYSNARDLGRDPQPGFALYLLASGKIADATRSIQIALAPASVGRPERVGLLAAQTEIAVATGDVDTARSAAMEIAEIADRFASSGLLATSSHVRGLALLAQGDAPGSLLALRDGLQRWQSLDAPYEAARVHVLIARAYQLLGDTEAAEQELDAAAPVFVRVGAIPDVRIVDRMRGRGAPLHQISEREAQVLVLVATGKTNREIGESLFISPKTVARHIENIYAKLSISSRSAATAWCIEHGLRVRGRG
jgi:DNA-binding CsgD family transcriptional regulator/tetratricopeptide (TPR) repeat protein